MSRYLPHFAIVLLLSMVVLSNYYETAQAKNITSSLVTVNQDIEHSVVASVGKYTSIPNAVSLLDKSNLALNASDGLIAYAAPLNTEITDRNILPDNSKSDIAYTVTDGDTLTALSQKFGVKVATLQYVNNFSNADTLKSGSQIKIPAKGYVIPASKNVIQLASATRDTVTRNSSTTKRTYDGDYSGSSDTGLIVPVSYSYISRGVGNGHTGIDYVCPTGTPVRAAAAGVIQVVSTGWSGGYGNMIIVNHGNGLATRYGHLSQINVTAGEVVSAGQVIGLSGSTGRSTGPHLHFEKMISGQWVYFDLR